MKLSALYLTSFALLPSFIAAAAIPDDGPHSEEASTLSKRGPEVNYIANCWRVNPSGGREYEASYVAWYSNQDYSQSGQVRLIIHLPTWVRATDTSSLTVAPIDFQRIQGLG